MINHMHFRYANVEAVVHMEARLQEAQGICNAIGFSKRVKEHEALRQPIISRHYHLPCVLDARHTHRTMPSKMRREFRQVTATATAGSVASAALRPLTQPVPSAHLWVPDYIVSSTWLTVPAYRIC